MALQCLSLLSDEELKELKDDFLKADVNKDGSLDKAEFTKLLSTLVKTEGAAEAMFAKFDVDGDGKVVSKEFLSAIALLSKGTLEQKLSELFSLYDADNSGSLTTDEIAALYTNLQQAAKNCGFNDALSEVGAKTMVSKLDANNDKKITKEEWLAFGKKYPALQNLLGVQL